MDNTTPVFVIDSTKGGKFHCTIMKNARGQQLQAALCQVIIDTDTVKQAVLGRIGMVDTTNFVHENPSFSPIIMEQGSVRFFSKDADIEKTIVDPIVCIDLTKENKPITARAANPSSGTPGYVLSNVDIQGFLTEKRHMMNIGHLPSYPNTIMSIINRHYGDGVDGWGEARHRLYAGQTGSGKTVFMLQHLAGRAVAYPHLGILMPDTKGDFTSDMHSNESGGYNFSFKKLLRSGGRSFEEINTGNVKLESTVLLGILLREILRTNFSASAEKAITWGDRVARFMADNKKSITLKDITLDRFFAGCRASITSVYSGATAKTKEALIDDMEVSPEWLQDDWDKKIIPYFSGYRSIWSIAQDVLQNGKLIILNMKGADKQIQDEIMAQLFNIIKVQCEKHYRETNSMVNAEVILDEAPRWVPQATSHKSSDNSQERAAAIIKDATRTTRAYGLAWTFITQRLADIDKGVMAQCSTKWFGRNLGVGVDRNHMADQVGKTGLQIYDMLQANQGYFYLGVGSELNLGSGALPLAVIGWSGDVNKTIRENNPHIWTQGGIF